MSKSVEAVLLVILMFGALWVCWVTGVLDQCDWCREL